MNLSGCRSYWTVLTGRPDLPPTSPAGWPHLGVPARRAESQIPRDPRAAPRGTDGGLPRGGVRSCPGFPRCRPAGARQGPRGLQGISEQWAAGSATGQCTPKYHCPPSVLHCQVPALPTGPSPWPGPPSSPRHPHSPQEQRTVRVHAGGGRRAWGEDLHPAAPRPRLLRREIYVTPPALRLALSPAALEINHDPELRDRFAGQGCTLGPRH